MSDSSRWTRVGRSDDLEGPGPHAVSAAGTDVVLVRGPSGLRAFEGRCPHQGALLGEGELEGDTLVCRNHRWRFSVESGQRDGGPQCLRSCPARDVGGDVEVDVGPLQISDRGDASRLRKPSDLPGPPAAPLLGSAHLLTPRSLHLQLEEWARRYGTPFSYRFGRQRVVVFAELSAMNPVFRNRPETFRRTTNIESIFRELKVDGVFSAEGDAWRPQRRLAMEALSHRHLRSFYPTVAEVATRLRRRWERAAARRDVLDLPEELKRFTVDLTTQLAFGHDLNTIEQEGDIIQDKLELLLPAVSQRLFAILPWWRIVRLPADRRLDRAVDDVRAWLRERVESARSRLAADPARAARPQNFLEAMLVAKDERGRPFDDEVVLGNALTMLVAGEDTTAYSVAWAVHHLIDAPSETAALRADVDRVLGDDAVPADIETAGDLTYAGAVANEAMRLRPVAPLFFFEPLTDTVIDDVEIPKGTTIALLTRVPATAAANFEEPARFRPARWVDGQASGAHEASAHQPFGSGPRICPGRTLALLEMKVLLATLYKSFDVTRVGLSDSVREVFAFTMVPEGLRVRLSPRAS